MVRWWTAVSEASLANPPLVAIAAPPIRSLAQYGAPRRERHVPQAAAVGTVGLPARSSRTGADGLRLRLGQRAALGLSHQLLLADHQLLADALEVHAIAFGFREHPGARLFLFLHMMLDVFGKHGDLRVIHLGIGIGLHQIVDQDLGAV